MKYEFGHRVHSFDTTGEAVKAISRADGGISHFYRSEACHGKIR
jgi:hypothetical protein